jgi:hypothetical protein
MYVVAWGWCNAPFSLQVVDATNKDHTQKNTLALKTVGLINIQFAIK